MKSLVASKYVENLSLEQYLDLLTCMKLNIVIQSVVVTILGLIILLSVPTITIVQATTNQSFAANEKMCQQVLNEIPSS
jgi:hypothetical protein